MKKKVFYLFALICSMSLFASCSDDDDPNYYSVIEKEIAGNYKGTLSVSIDGTAMPGAPQNITIEKASPTAINLSIKDFSFMGISIGNVELKNCALSQNGDTYTFTGTQNLKTDALSCVIDAKGTIVKGKVTIDMDVDATVGDAK
ncbi:MAG: calycin-like domain-containing protein [Bacteroides sp.]|nr:calycin-like domain-containing protein [Bacteroides sp.]